MERYKPGMVSTGSPVKAMRGHCRTGRMPSIGSSTSSLCTACHVVRVYVPCGLLFGAPAYLQRPYNRQSSSKDCLQREHVTWNERDRCSGTGGWRRQQRTLHPSYKNKSHSRSVLLPSHALKLEKAVSSHVEAHMAGSMPTVVPWPWKLGTYRASSLSNCRSRGVQGVSLQMRWGTGPGCT